MATAKPGQLVVDFEKAVTDPSLPHLYFNGFTAALGNGDITVLLVQSGLPIATLNMSFTMAKTMGQKLHDVIANLEARSGNHIMTTDDIGRVMETETP
jgi:hypothetical protein